MTSASHGPCRLRDAIPSRTLIRRSARPSSTEASPLIDAELEDLLIVMYSPTLAHADERRRRDHADGRSKPRAGARLRRRSEAVQRETADVDRAGHEDVANEDKPERGLSGGELLTEVLEMKLRRL
jgi:hypothetical protein